MAPRKTTVVPVEGDEDSEWEYEYHETETEVCVSHPFYPTKGNALNPIQGFLHYTGSLFARQTIRSRYQTVNQQ